MKRIFLSAIMLATVYAVCAQDPMPYRATDVTMTTYTAPPPYIQANFQATYPNATVVTWQPMSDWWYATYKDNNNRMVNVYYNTQEYYSIRPDETYVMTLPVLNTFVPEDVVANAVNAYGTDIYSITALKADENNNPKYAVTLIKNGTMETVVMNSSGTVYNSSTNDSSTTARY